MKRIILLLIVVLLAGSSQSDAAFTQDPVTVNAETIRLKFENDRVRVLEATIKPGHKENTHSHPAYLVYVVEGGEFRNHVADGTVSDGEFKTGDVIYRDGLTHWAENTGNTTLRLVLVELKK